MMGSSVWGGYLVASYKHLKLSHETWKQILLNFVGYGSQKLIYQSICEIQKFVTNSNSLFFTSS